MTSFLRQIFLLLVALSALAILLMMITTADAKDFDGTRQIVVEPSPQSDTAPASESEKGAASTDLTEESGDTVVGALAEDAAPEQPEPEIHTEAEQPAIAEREAFARAYLYALYLRAAQRGRSGYGQSYSDARSYSYARSYDHCDH